MYEWRKPTSQLPLLLKIINHSPMRSGQLSTNVFYPTQLFQFVLGLKIIICGIFMTLTLHVIEAAGSREVVSVGPSKNLVYPPKLDNLKQ